MLVDPSRAEKLEMFMSAAESLCEVQSVNFQRAQRNAERLGFDMDGMYDNIPNHQIPVFIIFFFVYFHAWF